MIYKVDKIKRSESQEITHFPQLTLQNFVVQRFGFLAVRQVHDVIDSIRVDDIPSKVLSIINTF